VVDSRPRRIVEIERARPVGDEILNDADDLQPGARWFTIFACDVANASADRVSSGEHFLDERSRDDDRGAARGQVAGVEPASRQDRCSEHLEEVGLNGPRKDLVRRPG
jgi:hypothetical protein